MLDCARSGQADGIHLNLPLHWTPDSVTGTETFLVFRPNTSHRGFGRVALSPSHIEDCVVGHTSFDNGWTPPYDAVQKGAAYLDGHFMSVDAGPCL